MQPVTVVEAFEAFLMAKRAENVQPGTLKLYRWTMTAFGGRWPGLSLGEVTPDHFRSFIVTMQAAGIASATVHIHYRNLRAFLSWCQAEDLAGPAVLRNVKGPKVDEGLPEVLSEAEAVRLLKAVKKSGRRHAYRDYTIALFFLTTGARLSELAGLELSDVSLEGSFARLNGKGRRQRLVPLFDVLPMELKRYLLKHRQAGPNEPAFFVAETGGRLNPVTVQQIIIDDLRAYVPRSLERLGPHVLRHTACTFLLRRLTDIKRVAAIMGHSNLETTERYTHLNLDDLRGVRGPTLDQLLSAGRRPASL